MKQNLLKTMLVSTALVAGTMGVWAENGNGIITSLPVETQTFDDANGIFKGGETGDFGGAVGNVLRINKTTATATFDSDAKTDGNQAYVLASKEKVTINFTAFQGWIGSGISEFKILNSEGNSLVSYKYDHNLCKISEVKIGGVDVSGFEAFACQSGPSANGKKCNGFSNSKYQGYINDATKNPQIAITVSGNGFVSIRFVISALKIDKEFSSSVGDLKTDLASISINSSVNNEDRAYAIDNFSIGTETTQEATASYIVKKMCGTTELGSETGAGIVGTTPTLAGADMWVDGKKYIYVSNDVDEKGGITASGSTYTLTYREAATYNYSVIGKVDDVVIKEFAKGHNFEGETVSSPYLRYVEKDGVWYEAARSKDSYYQTSAVLAADNQDLAISYKKADINNVAYFKEAEEIEGLTVSTNQNADVRCSNAAGAYNSSETPVVVTTLPAGTYQLTVGLWGGKQDQSQNFKLNDGGKEPWTIPFIGSFQDVSKELVLETETEISIPKSDAANGRCLDYVLVQKTAEPVSVSAVKFATYVPTINVVVPAEAKVYTAKVNKAKSAVVLTEVPAGSVIAKGTPVLVGAEAGSYTFVASADEATTVADNDLKAATADTKGNGSTIYALVEQNGEAVFAPLKEGVAVSLGHAYLELPAASATRFYSIQFGGETTGINEVNAAAKADGAYYTLQGVKTSKAAKGIYIHNGKKVVIK